MCAATEQMFTARRFTSNPLLTPQLARTAGENINGPSIIRNAAWCKNGLGPYLMYFGHHEGQYIRLAHADNLQGPWHLYGGEVLPCASLPWRADHIASPHACVDDAAQVIRLYFHSPVAPMIKASDPLYARQALNVPQRTFVALSRDGIHFDAHKKELGPSYFAVWPWQNAWYALPREGKPLLRSADGLRDFCAIPNPLEGNPSFAYIRHVSALVQGKRLFLFFTRIGDVPERILYTTIQMADSPWQAADPVELLRPEMPYEGAELPLQPSRFGMSTVPECALRDPCIFCEGGKRYIFYVVQGERGIAGCELIPCGSPT